MKLYFVSIEFPAHKVWGIYTRRQKARTFRLATVMLDRQAAITQGEALMAQDPELQVSVQGAATSRELPEQYKD